MLYQLSREKKEMEASVVESVRVETAKALEGAQEVNQRPLYSMIPTIVWNALERVLGYCKRC